MTRAALAHLPLWVAGLALGPATVVLVRAHAAQALADTPERAVLELAAGWILLAVGLVAWLREPGNRTGGLLAAAGAASFLAEWANPGIGWTSAFTAGLVLYAAGPPLVAHAVLAHPSGRLGSWPARGLLLLAYGNAVLVLGLLQAVVYDPWGAGCTECPGNGLLIVASSGMLDALGRIGMAVGAIWPYTLILLLAWRAVRASPALRRVCAPLWLAGGAYATAVAADFVHGLPRHTLSNDPADRRFWLAQEAALLLLAAAASWPWLLERRTRQALADLVVELASAPAPGGLRDALARVLGDPSLTLAYPLADGRLVDAQGRPSAMHDTRSEVAGGARRDRVTADPKIIRAPVTVTELARGDRTLALLGHRRELLSEPRLGPAPEIARISRLALDNERLHAELAARMTDLRASRTRIVATGDTERRRLERDLHDGAQQRLLALALTLRLARTGAAGGCAEVDEAERELRTAIKELRALAHGLFPAVLADEGLTSAVGALLEETRSPARIPAFPTQRLDPAVEAAAYFVIAEAIAHRAITVSAALSDGRLLLELDGTRGLGLLRIADRVGALDGIVTAPEPPHTAIRVEIPCRPCPSAS